MHQFATQKLAEQPQEKTQTQAHYAAFYAELVARAGWELEPGDPQSKATLDGESANVLAAWRWAIAQKEPNFTPQTN